MRSVQTDGSTHFHHSLISPACLAFTGTATGLSSANLYFTHPPSCTPSLHAHYRHFITTMGTLNPVRLSSSYRPPYVTCTAFLTIPAPTTLCTPRRSFNTLPLSSTGLPTTSGSRLRSFPSRLAGSTRPNRVRYLRTGRSPPVASHPASWRRSYSRLQAGERMPGGDSHPSDCARL